MKRQKRRACLVRTSIVLTLGLVFLPPAFSQATSPSGGKIGASNGEIAGAFVGAGAAVAVIVIVIYHETHKHHTLTGCISSGTNGLTLANEKDNKVYTLSGDSGSLKVSERVAIRGKKLKNSGITPTFRIEKLEKDYGACRS